LLLVPFGRGRDVTWVGFATRAAKVGIAGVVLMLAATLPRAVMHQQAYGSVLLLVIAGAVAIANLRALPSRLLVAAALTYFAVVWIVHPLSIAERLYWPAVFAMGQGALLAWLAAMWIDQGPTAGSPSKHVSSSSPV